MFFYAESEQTEIGTLQNPAVLLEEGLFLTSEEGLYIILD